LYIRNLPYAADEDAIKRVFQRFGNVVSVRIARRSDTQVSKGFAYVEFEARAGAEGAVAAAAAVGGLQVGGRGVVLDYDTSAGPRAGFKTADGRAFSKVAEGKASSGGGGGRGGGAGGGARAGRKDAGVGAHSQG